MNREDAGVGVLHFHEVHAAVGAGQLILNATLQLEVLDLEQLRLACDLVRQQVPSAIAEKGPSTFRNSYGERAIHILKLELRC